MGCGCTIDGYSDGDSYAFHIMSMRKALKEHKCGECCRKIAKGETYEVSKGMFEGTFDAHKTCTDCLSLRKEFFCSWSYSTLWYDFECEAREFPEEISYDSVANLTHTARTRACEIIEQVWSDEDDEESYAAVDSGCSHE